MPAARRALAAILAMGIAFSGDGRSGLFGDVERDRTAGLPAP
jgi:hypothetical protein